MFKRMKSNLYFFYATVKKAHKSKSDFFFIALDLLYCKMRFHITNEEYLTYEFYNLKDRYRKNFVLIYHRLRKFKNISVKRFTKSKYDFYAKIPDLFQREIIRIPDCGEAAFLEFVKKHTKIIVKPDEGSLGRGVEVLEYNNNDAEIKKRFEMFSQKEPMICEEYIKQHQELQKLYPFSVNTIRIVSILKDGNVEITAAVLKAGATGTAAVDHVVNGGIGAQVDVETGIVTTFGKDHHSEKHSHHPISGVQIIGMNIPNWDKAIELVKKAHARVPQCLIYGWDIAITETGADIVEGNNAPGPKITQSLDKVPKGEKLLPLLKKKYVK